MRSIPSQLFSKGPEEATHALRLTAGSMLLAVLFAACADESPGTYQGYVEGEYVYVAAPLAGELVELVVERGQAVEAGDLLFQLDPAPQRFEAAESRKRLSQARSKLADLSKGSRASELAALEARLSSARSALEGAQRDFERRRELHESGRPDAVSESEFDRFRTDRDLRAADVRQLEADLETARLGGRSDALAAAQAEVDALVIATQALDWQVEQKQGVAPAAGIVEDTLYRAGEFVPAGRPVVSMLPPENVEIRFFIPQALLPGIAIGDPLSVRLDGMNETVKAQVSFISSSAEFTPPVIYSKESRAKLVFMVKAVPEADALDRLRPGQPLDVYLDRFP